MPTIIERNGRFLCRVRKQGFPPVAQTFIKRADAKAWGLRTEADMQGGRWVDKRDDSAATLREAVEQYKTVAAARFKGFKSYDFVLDDLAAKGFATKAPRDVTSADFARWRDGMAAAGLKPGTVTRRLALAAGFMRWCHKDKGLVDGNPLHGVSRPKVNDARSRVMSTDEVRYLMAGAQARDHRASWLPDALTILLRSAMRRGELHALTVGVVDFDECTAHLRAEQTKNGHARTVPLDPSALAALRRLADKATARGAILRERGRDAPASGNERLIPVAHANGITLAFMRALARAREAYETDCEAAGVAADPGFLRGLRLHDARHDAITKWAATGQLSVHELLMVSGHRDTKTLARYVNLAPSVLAGKLARVGATSASEVTHDRPRSLDVHAGSGADAAARRD